jgi:hypothetical protein
MSSLADKISAGRRDFLRSLPPRVRAYGVALLITAFLIVMLSLTLRFNSPAASFLLDYSKGSLFEGVYPLTIQNMLHFLTAIGLAELWVRWQSATREARILKLGLLPEDDHTMLVVEELGPIRRRFLPYLKSGSVLPALADLVLLQMTTTRSVEQATSAMSSKLDLISHRLDLEYQMLRYIAWLIPTMGFIGTVVGISLSLKGLQLSSGRIDLGPIVAGLAISFNTTILALMESALLMFLLNVTQRREELALNSAADYCLTNLINRVYVKT